ncbi:hypothetical protein [Kineococcus sp. SYSU DK001]|uniref:hypothetical protein n=1 Tax=Kineococcus sp. SYSU DK001 TaxID=3383122 RepID=UPI003D7ECDBC
MQLVYEGRMAVSYFQAYLSAGDVPDDYEAAFAGQVNGLAGGQLPGHLTLLVGVHTGDVGLRVLLCEQAPPVGQEWEDVVEAPFTPQWPEAVLAGCLSDAVCDLYLDQPSYRARWSARGIDAGRDADVVMADEPLVDHYELVLWPAPPAPDAIVRVGSQTARYRHRMQDPAFARAAQISAMWGETPLPSEALLDVLDAPWLVELDRDLAEDLVAAEPGVQRAVAYWAAQWACARTGVDRADWIAAALRTLGEDRLLPALFHDSDALYARLDDSLPAPDGEASAVNGWPHSPAAYAVSSLVTAAGTDPLDAVVSTLKQVHEAIGDEHADVFLAQARQELGGARRELTEQSGLGHVVDHRPPFTEPDPLEEVPEGMDPEEYFDLCVQWGVQDGEQLPSARLLAVGGRASSVGRRHRELAEALAALPAGEQRAVAVWAARQACTLAGLAGQDWIEESLHAAAGGGPLPPLWSDPDQVLAKVFPADEGDEEDEEQVEYSGSYISWAEEEVHQPYAPEVVALDALQQSALPDPAEAVVGAVDALSLGHEKPRTVLEDVHRRLSAGDLPQP